jgi:hypothetical protein
MSRTSAWAAPVLLACAFFIAAGGAEAAPKKKKKSAPTPTAEAAPKTTDKATEETANGVGAGNPVSDFDKQAAVTAITEVNLSKCKATNAAKGDGHVMITFTPQGAASSATVDKGPWVGTPVAKCMVKEFKKAKVPAFKGEAVTVGKTFHFE